MIRINLLPFRAARKQENIRKQLSIFSLSLLLLLIILTGVHAYLASSIDRLDVSIKNTKEQLAKYNKINNEIAQIKKDLQSLQKKIDVIKSLDNNRDAPVKLLDDMTKLIVSNQMWFTQFNTSGKSVKVDGIAMDNQTVADFMTRVEKTGKYYNVRLSSIKQKKLGGRPLSLKSFGITFERSDLINPVKMNKGKK